MGKHPHVGSRTVTAHHRRQIATQPTNTVARMTANVPPSAIGRLLDEISWEGNARKYCGGGIGKENVLTTEVFSALDFLPRTAFLGAVLATASGASQARAALIDQIEAGTVEVLSGDTRPSLPNGKPATWTIQPDGLITTPTAVCFIEAKRLRSASFQPRQIARTAITINDWSATRNAFALLVLPTPPPLHVAGHGRQSIPEALQLGLDDAEWTNEEAATIAAERFAWITWTQLNETVQKAAAQFAEADPSMNGTVHRLAAEIANSIQRHS